MVYDAALKNLRITTENRNRFKFHYVGWTTCARVHWTVFQWAWIVGFRTFYGNREATTDYEAIVVHIWLSGCTRTIRLSACRVSIPPVAMFHLHCWRMCMPNEHHQLIVGLIYWLLKRFASLYDRTDVTFRYKETTTTKCLIMLLFESPYAAVILATYRIEQKPFKPLT